MQKSELKTVIDYMEREKGLEKEVLVETIRMSLQSAARKSIRNVQNPQVEINPDTFEVTVLGDFTVVGPGHMPEMNELALDVARDYKSEAEVGDVLRIEVTPENFGRIAAQTAKQVIIQKIRDAESDVVFREYKDKVGQVISGTVRQSDRKGILIDLGRGEAVLHHKERIEGEEYRIGDRLKLLVLDVKKHPSSTEICVSRSHPNFVKRLFEIEVPEISDKTIEIKGVAREPGYRTKIAVHSNDPKVDCVGACVGMRGSRVKNIVQELNGEKIDIVPWAADVAQYCRNALNPAKLRQVELIEGEKKVQIFVDKAQFSLAIGKRGSNARLTSRLLGWKVDIEPIEKGEEPSSDTAKDQGTKGPEKIQEAVDLSSSVTDIDGLSKKVKDFLVEGGYKTLGDLEKLNENELFTIPGVGKSSADEIMELIRDTIQREKDKQ